MGSEKTKEIERMVEMEEKMNELGNIECGCWFGKTGKELKKEIDNLLDRIQSIDRNLISSREHAIYVLLSFADSRKSDFIEFAENI